MPHFSRNGGTATVFRPNRGTHQLVWATQIINLSIVAAGQAGQQGVNLNVPLETALGRNIVGGTIMRIRGRIFFTEGATGIAEVTNIMLGVGVFTEGVDDADFPDMALGSASWMLYEMFVFRSSTAGENTVVSPNEQYVIGTKAMRKIDGNQTKLTLVVQSLQAGDINVRGQVRVLLKMP